MDDCHRIGYGGGFYDRTIQKLQTAHKKKFLSIGVAFEAQKFDRFTGHLAGEDDIWHEGKCTKIS
jgi:5-formyltetrahydrofolate cyclo-ligase